MRREPLTWALYLCAAFILARLILLSLSGDAQIAAKGAIVDDAFFYTVVADNFHRNGEFSFDGISVTNGFHPLWLAILILIRNFFSFTYPASILMWASLPCIATFLICTARYASKELGARSSVIPVAVAATLVCNQRFVFGVTRGLETPLAMALIMFVVIGWGSATKLPSPLRSFLCGMLALARLDLGIFLPVELYYCFRCEARRGRRLFSSLFLAVAPIAGYLLFSHLHFGSIFPISGTVKHFHAMEAFHGWSGYLSSPQATGFFESFRRGIPTRLDGASFILLYAAWNLTALIGTALGPRSLRFFGIAVALHIAILVLYVRELTWTSYYYLFPWFIWSSLSVAVAIDLATRRWLATQVAAAALCITVAILNFQSSLWGYAFSYTGAYTLAQRVRELVPKDEPVAAFWPGYFAAYSEHRIIGLDGLVNSSDYFERYVRSGTQLDFLFEQRIKYLAIYFEVSAAEALKGAPQISLHWPFDGSRQFISKRDQFETVSILENENKSRTWLLTRVRKTPDQANQNTAPIGSLKTGSSGNPN